MGLNSLLWYCPELKADYTQFFFIARQLCGVGKKHGNLSSQGNFIMNIEENLLFSVIECRCGQTTGYPF